MQRFLILLALVLPLKVTAGDTCDPKKIAYVDSTEVYRAQRFDAKSRTCVGMEKLYVVGSRDKQMKRIKMDGFEVVGIENSWNNLGEIVKVTSKAGAHTTITKLLRVERDGSLSEIAGGEFSSMSDDIAVEKDGSGGLLVRTRDVTIDEKDCQVLLESYFKYQEGSFVPAGKKVVNKRCP